MFRRLSQFSLSVLLCFAVVACGTTPATRAPEPQHVATAKRFLHSWGAGHVAMTAFKRQLEVRAKEQPGMAELVRRAFSNVTAEQFEDMAARVYARHLSHEHLHQLAQFSESRSGNRLFRVAIAGAMEGKKTDDMMSQFSADELTELMKFSQGDAFTAMSRALPAINRELAEEARVWGEATMRDYLKRQ